MARELVADFSVLLHGRVYVQASLGCRMTLQRLFVLLLALGRSCLAPEDISAEITELDTLPFYGSLRGLESPRLAYGQLYRLHGAGLMTQGESGFALERRTRQTLERVLALDQGATVDVDLDAPDIGYSVQFHEWFHLPSGQYGLMLL